MATVDVLLALLTPGPSHGYDLKRAHDEWFREVKPLAFGQVYASLSRLKRDGFVDVVNTEAGAGPERTIYELTDTGRHRVGEWLADPVEPDPPGSNELIRRTVTALRLGRDPGEFLARQRAVLLRRIRELTDAAASDPVTALMHDHAIAHLDADLRWLDTAAQRLTSRSGER